MKYFVNQSVSKVCFKFGLAILVGISLFYIPETFAAASGSTTTTSGTIGGVASSITDNFKALAKLITGVAYVAGLGFAVGAILKFKAHKDNPTQIPIGTPVALLLVAIALVFIPSVVETTGKTAFGTSMKSAGASGSSDVGTTQSGGGTGG